MRRASFRDDNSRHDRRRPLYWWESGPGRITVALPRGSTAVIAPRGARRGATGPRDVPSNGTWTKWGCRADRSPVGL